MKQRNITILLIPILILVIFWVIFNVYHNFVSSTITDPLTYQIIPIQGKFDSATIDSIKARKTVIPANEILAPNPTSQSEILDENNASNSAKSVNLQEEE